MRCDGNFAHGFRNVCGRKRAVSSVRGIEHPNAAPFLAQLSPGRSRIVRRLVIDHLDFEGLADLQLGEILGIGPQCDHPRVCPEQEAAVLRIDRQDLPLDSGRRRLQKRNGR